MPNQRLFEIPSITDEDVEWVCEALELPSNAFSGTDGTDPRLDILKSNDTLDIEACPGSGKTTLLVAKLAILARKWNSRSRGICVLSHTNVARKEIENRIGSTAEANRLLAYPHFVGTIHSFVNEFLAIPWLHSKSMPIKMIDDNVCKALRCGILPPNTKYALSKNNVSPDVLEVKDIDYSVGDIRWGKGNLSCSTPTYLAVQDACKVSCEKGFFCYDEMFVWGNELLDKCESVRNAIRERFPICFIDEVQDNSEIQSKLLYHLFVEGDRPVFRQRFGDANQAIYQQARQTEGATTDCFPDDSIRKDIPKSHRFNQEIGELSEPLATESVGIVGCGPSGIDIASDTNGKHAVLLFNDDTIQFVIPAFATYLMEVFSEDDLHRGTFYAVGGVHRPDREDNLPRTVSHYWPSYDYELTVAEPRPRTFQQYLAFGRKLANVTGQSHFVVEKIAEGILHLICLSDPAGKIDNRKRKHLYILDLLSDDPDAKQKYLDFATYFVVSDNAPSIDEWNNTWSRIVNYIVEVISGIKSDSDEIRAFLTWQDAVGDGELTQSQQLRDNIYRYPIENPKIQIQVGSVHSVKGETHTATLVLDTFYYAHNLKTLKPWLLKQKYGKGSESDRNISRLKQHYVAMTRPSHLLCLAMREDAFNSEEIDELKKSWRVARVTETGYVCL